MDKYILIDGQNEEYICHPKSTERNRQDVLLDDVFDLSDYAFNSIDQVIKYVNESMIQAGSTYTFENNKLISSDSIYDIFKVYKI